MRLRRSAVIAEFGQNGIKRIRGRIWMVWITADDVLTLRRGVFADCAALSRRVRTRAARLDDGRVP